MSGGGAGIGRFGLTPAGRRCDGRSNEGPFFLDVTGRPQRATGGRGGERGAAQATRRERLHRASPAQGRTDGGGGERPGREGPPTAASPRSHDDDRLGLQGDRLGTVSSDLRPGERRDRSRDPPHARGAAGWMHRSAVARHVGWALRPDRSWCSLPRVRALVPRDTTGQDAERPAVPEVPVLPSHRNHSATW